MSAQGNPLETLAATGDFWMFRPVPENAPGRPPRWKAGRPPFDPVMKFPVVTACVVANGCATGPSDHRRRSACVPDRCTRGTVSRGARLQQLDRSAVTRSRVQRLPLPVFRPLRFGRPAMTSSLAKSASVRTASTTVSGVALR